MPNRLAKELSPYLLQHANNPVDWYPWGNEALEKARAEDKPILVSIGYSACHWCHVMERESFENHDIANIMNAHFVNIKIDREERPDLDHIYMDAVQAMTGSGGWPLNVFLTPDKKPFFGGTYFPPLPAHGRGSWRDTLEGISNAYRTRRNEIEAQSDYLITHLGKLNSFGTSKKPIEEDQQPVSKDEVETMAKRIMKTADKVHGGFGNAPKFPQTFTIQFLLRHYYATGNRESLQQACLSLDQMIMGGIYDQLGGGFARYSTDESWLVPHFEKMLYDNALLVTVISEAYQLTGNAIYGKTIMDTLSFMERELMSPEGGFYSALDADSEGEEGKFYVWEKEEIEEVLGPDATAFCSFYQVTDKGNWEGKNILHRDPSVEIRDAQEKSGVHEEQFKLESAKGKLLAHRSKRVRPSLDDKVILGWNAMVISAYCKAYAALGNEKYKEMAVSTYSFLVNHFKLKDSQAFHHVYKQGESKIKAFLDDYAALIQAMIQLQEVTGEDKYLLNARDLAEWIIVHFGEKDSSFFYFTHDDQEDVIIRKKEIYDGAVPSGNSLMSAALLYLGIVFDRPDWKKIALDNCLSIANMVTEYPGSFGIWATLYQALTYGINEVVIIGKKPNEIRKNFLRNFIPWRVFQSADTQNNQFPLLRGKPCLDQPQIFLCRDYSCQVPVTEVAELVPLLETFKNN